MADGIVVCNGAREVMQELGAMRQFMYSRPDSYVADPGTVPPIAALPASAVRTSDERTFPFDTTLSLLQAHGVPVAPSVFVDDDAPVVDLPFGPPWVVKLAGVAHRAGFGALRLNVTSSGLSSAITELRALASTAGLPARIVIQPMIEGHGEAFVGLVGETGIGPMALFGLGGVFVEALNRTAGRLAPFDSAMAREMIGEFAGTGILDGYRGGPAWNLEPVSQLLIAASPLVAGAVGWLETLDINPVIITPTGCVAVDALAVRRG